MALPWTNTKYSKDLTKLEKELFSNLCRVCMSDSVNKLKCMFSSESSRTIEKFKICTGILITREDGLPTKLCDLCYKTLDIAHKFKTACLRSDNIFRNIIKKQNLHKTEVKLEIEEGFEVPISDLEFQDSTKQEIDTYSDDDDYDNDDDFLCDINPGPTTTTRLKVKSEDKNTITRTKNNISKGKIYAVKTEKKRKDTGYLDGKEGKLNTLCCTLCDIKFNNKTDKLRHMREKHVDFAITICEVCGMRFKHRSTYYSHVLKHQPPQFHCDQCDYMTCYRHDMKKHLNIHKGIKNYLCKYCSKSFVSASSRADHARRTHIAKKHVCPRCGRAFSEASKLRTHLDRHDNIRRFECKVCQSRFLRRRQWKNHLMKIHNISVPRARPGRPKI